MPGGTLRGFAERVALVTGGSGLTGVGRAVALQLALEGAFVIVTHTPGDGEAKHVAERLRELGTLAHAIEADMRHEADIERIFAAVEELYGRLDLLVFVASIEHGGNSSTTFEEESIASFDGVLSANLRAATLCAQAGLRLMRGRPSAGIINVVGASSMTGRAQGSGVRTSAAQIAAGTGIIGLTEALANELAPRVRVNCVAVGERTHSLTSADTLLPPDEAARACLYLLSPEAKHITGQTLLVGA